MQGSAAGASHKYLNARLRLGPRNNTHDCVFDTWMVIFQMLGRLMRKDHPDTLGHWKPRIIVGTDSGSGNVM